MNNLHFIPNICRKIQESVWNMTCEEKILEFFVSSRFYGFLQNVRDVLHGFVIPLMFEKNSEES